MHCSLSSPPPSIAFKIKEIIVSTVNNSGSKLGENSFLSLCLQMKLAVDSDKISECSESAKANSSAHLLYLHIRFQASLFFTEELHVTCGFFVATKLNSRN